MPAVGQTVVQEFFLPLPEDQVRAAMVVLQPSTTISQALTSVTSIVVASNGTEIVFDHWEDGYEVSLNGPAQASTRVWGNGIDADGIAPGFANDPTGLTAGTVIALRNDVPLPRNAANLFYDGRDRVGATKAIVVSRASWAPTPGTVFAGAVDVSSTIDYGTSYVSPIGQDVPNANSMFERVFLFVMAAENGTTVTIDTNGDGTTDVTTLLNRGQSYSVNGGIITGATVTASKPVQAHLITGDVNANYEARRYAIYPQEQWSDSYLSPVGTASDGDDTYVFLYNPDPVNPLIIDYVTRTGTGSFTITADTAAQGDGVYRFLMPQNSGTKFTSRTAGSKFFAVATVGAEPSANNAHDWGFPLVPDTSLTTELVVGWGPGSDGAAPNYTPTANGSPAWVTASVATTLYIDFNGDGGPNTAANGRTYDTAYSLAAYESYRIFEADMNQTGLRVFTVDGTPLAGAWGQDPASSQPGNPFLDLGTTVLPFPVPTIVKTWTLHTDPDNNGLDVGDTIEYTLTVNNRSLLPLGNFLVVDPLPAALQYVAGTSTRDGAPIADNTGAYSPFPLDPDSPGGGYTVPVLLRGGVTAFTFRTLVIAPGSVANTGSIPSEGLEGEVIVDVPPPAGSNPCDIEFTNAAWTPVTTYTVGDTVYIQMADVDAQGFGTVTVTVVNQTTGDLETITLTETAPGSGVFRGSVPASPTGGLAQQDGTLRALDGDTLYVDYTDPLYGDSDADTALVIGPSRTKHLYLDTDGGDGDATGDLDRVDPVNVDPQDTTTSQTQALFVSYPNTIGEDTASSATDDGAGGGAIVAGTAASNRVTTASSLSITSYTPVASANLMLVGVTIANDTDTVSSVTWNPGSAQSLTRVGFQTDGGNYRVEIWQLENPTAGSGTVTVTFSGSVVDATAGVQTFANVDLTQARTLTGQGGALDTSNGAKSFSLAVATASGDVVFDTTVVESTEQLSAGASQVQDWSLPNNATQNDKGAGSHQTATGTTTTMTWNVLRAQNSQYAQGAVRLRPASGGGVSTVTLSHTVGSGSDRFMLVGVSFKQTGTAGDRIVQSVTYAGTSLSLVSSHEDANALTRVELWRWPDGTQPPTGTANVVVTMDGTPSNPESIVVGVQSFANVSQTSSLGTVAQAHGASGNPSVSVATASGDLAFDVVSYNGSTTLSAGTGQTPALWSATAGTSNQTTGAASTEAASGTSVSMDWTSTNSGAWAQLGVAIKPTIVTGTTAATFTQTPVLASALTLVPGPVTVTAYAEMVSGTPTSGDGTINVAAALSSAPGGASPAFPAFGAPSATLQAGTGPNGGDVYLFTWTATIAATTTVPANDAIRLTVTTSDADFSFRLLYDSSSYPSKIALPTSTVIKIDALDFYSAAYPGGSVTPIGTPGMTYYIRASVSDPFGRYDITGLDLDITPPSGPPAATLTPVVVDDGSNPYVKVFEAGWTAGAVSGHYTALATAREGYEGTVLDTSSEVITITELDLGTPSTTEFTSSLDGPHTLTYPDTGTVYVRTIDLDQNTDPLVAETIQVTLTTTTGDTEVITLTETGPNTGIFVGSIPNSTAPGASGNGNLYTLVGTVITVTYVDPNDPSDTSGDTANVPGAGPAVAVVKSLLEPTDGTATVGQTVRFRIVVTNTGASSLSPVALTDTYPFANLDYISASPAPDTVNEGTGTLTWTDLSGAGSLAPGDSYTIELTFTALAAATPATNTANVTTGGGPTASDTADVTITDPRVAVTKVLKAGSPSPAGIGQNVTFTITVQNTGTTAIATLPLTDSFPAALLQYVSASPTPPDGVGVGGSLLWNDLTGAGDLAVGGSYTIDVTFTVIGDSDPDGVPPTTLAENVATVDFAVDVNNDPVPPASSTAGVETQAARIAGRVYDDKDRSGTLTGGDTGLGGVTVQLYTDPNGDGDPSDGVLVQVTATAANGSYEFLNLDNGNYVIVETDPFGYYSTGDSVAPPGPGHNDNRIPVTIAGLADDTDNDFFDALLGTASGHVYFDRDGNGSQDLDGADNIPGNADDEVNLAGVDVLVTDSNGATQTVTTNANGDWSASVPPGNTSANIDETDPQFTAVVQPGWTITQGTDPTTLNVPAGGSASTITGFYNPPPPTIAVVSQLSARLESGVALIEWDTVSEIGTLSYNLYRAGKKGVIGAPLNEEPVFSVGVPQGGHYRVADLAALPGETLQYMVEEVEDTGARRAYGPYTVKIPVQEGMLYTAGIGLRPLPPAAALASLWDWAEVLLPAATAHAVDPAKAARAKVAKPGKGGDWLFGGLPGMGKGKAVAGPWSSVSGRMKIPVGAAGVRFLSAQAIADGLGTTPDVVTWVLTQPGIVLSCQGREIGCVPAAGGAGLYFYGEEYRSPYTTTNVYWLAPGKPRTAPAPADGQTPEPAPGGSFVDLLRLEYDVQAIPQLVSRPEDGLWVWGGVVATATVQGERTAQAILPNPVLDDGGTAGLLLHLLGGNETEQPVDHRVEVAVNGTVVGTGEWDGKTPCDLALAFPAALLREGANTILLRALLPDGVTTNVVYLDWLELLYPRRYIAQNDQLTFGAEGRGVVTVGGFTDRDIVVFDITNPARVGVVGGLTVGPDGAGGFAASFVPPTREGRYVAFRPAAVPLAAGTLVPPSALLAKKTGAAHVIVTVPALMAAAQPLADHRTANGLPSRVVSLQDIYDTFNHGLAEPQAIRAFLRHAYGNWKPAPRYALLAGDGTYDYLNILRRGDNLVPPVLVNTPYGLVSGDATLGDVAGSDGLPEIAVGRLPVMNAGELTAAIAKILAYETATPKPWATDVVLGADAADDGGDFPADSERLAAAALSGRSLLRLYLADTALADARTALQDAVNSGAGFVNWIGHGGRDRLSRSGLLTAADVPSLANAGRYPVFVAASCVIGQFEVPGFDCLGEVLLLKPDGGAVAVWAPTSLAYNELSNQLDRGFFDAVYVRRIPVLGDAVRSALAGYRAPAPFLFRGFDARQVYTVLGDPALRLQVE